MQPTSIEPAPMAHVVRSFDPVAVGDARVLVLGSMPGTRSLQAQQYYAHPQNGFWPFMGALVGANPALPYPERCGRLTRSGIALWDVLASCERPGSLDSAIRDDTARANDFVAFFAAHPGIGAVLFNGAKAESSYRRFVMPTTARTNMEYRRLPSTSPANASQRREDKLAAWREGLRGAGIAVRGQVEGAADSLVGAT